MQNSPEKPYTFFIEQFKHYLQLERGLSANSIQAYLQDCTKLSEFMALRKEVPNIEAIRLEDLRQFIHYLAEIGLSARSQARVVSGLKAFFEYLHIEHFIEKNPSELLETPRLAQKLPVVLSLQEIEAMLANLDLSRPDEARNRAIIEVLYSCGLRVSELTNLQISNLYLDASLIKVMGKGQKERFVPIGEAARKYLRIYLQAIRPEVPVKPNYEDFVFLNRRGKSLSRVMIFKIVKDLASRANIYKNVSPHTFRHSFASHLVEGGADLIAVQEMLGHESIATTEIYTHLDTAYLQQTLRDFHPRS